MILTSFWSNAVVLLSVIAPIALAEGSPAYPIAAGIVVLLGWWSSFWKRPRVMGEPLARVIIVLAFGYLVVEYMVFDRILVTALSHFMITFCLVRLVQVRRPREDAQIVVVCLMLLVIAAIVSGNILFAIALLVVMTRGLSLLAELHMSCESAHALTAAGGGSSSMVWPGGGSGIGGNDSRRRASLRPVVVGMSLLALSIGAVVFVICPRLESSFFNHFQSTDAGPVLTGFSASMELTGGQTISPSERAVMRVVVKGAELEFAEGTESQLYFRGSVSDRYGRRVAGLAAGWGWQRPAMGSQIQTVEMDEETHEAVLEEVGDDAETVEYQFWLERGDYSNLFTPCPVIRLESRDFSEFRFNRTEQIVRIQKTKRLVRYNVTTLTPETGNYGHDAAEPAATVPEVSLPRADEILESINEQVGEFGLLDVPANRQAFLEKLQSYLSSTAFSYSLSPPSVPVGREPVGEFLLRTREGHCEYFASAMVVVCQLKGIPARYVTGYRGGDYNGVGGFLVVRQKHAHAWVEAFIPEKGWIVFDPTPSASRVAAPASSWFAPARTLLDYLQFQWANLVIAYNASARQELIDGFHAWLTRPARDETTLVGAVVAFVRELFGWRLEMSASDRLLYWVFALLVAILALLIAHVLIRGARNAVEIISRWRGAMNSRASYHAEAEFYYRLCRRLEAMGLRRRAGQTPAEFAEQLASQHVAFAGVPELVRIYYGLVFGERTLSASEHDWVQDYVSSMDEINLASVEAAEAHARS